MWAEERWSYDLKKMPIGQTRLRNTALSSDLFPLKSNILKKNTDSPAGAKYDLRQTTIKRICQRMLSKTKVISHTYGAVCYMPTVA